MKNLESSIKEYVIMVWSTLFEQDIDCDDQEFDPPLQEPRLGIVDISGNWNGFVNIYVPYPLAIELTEKMFFLEAGSSSKSEVEDSIGEIINMIGGNIKAILPEPNQLSTPSVIWDANSHEWLEAPTVLAGMSFKSKSGHPFKVQIRPKA